MSQAVPTIDQHKEPISTLNGHMPCWMCAIWRTVMEDSVSQEYGVCPRRTYPDCVTHYLDGCLNGVLSLE